MKTKKAPEPVRRDRLIYQGAWSKWSVWIGLILVAAKGLDFTIGVVTLGRRISGFEMAAVSWATRRRFAKMRRQAGNQ